MIKDDKKRTHIIVTGKGGGSDAGAVRFDEAQTLTSAEQLQARENIGAISQEDVLNYKQIPSEWDTAHTMADLIADIAADNNAVEGKSYMGTVSLSDLPASLLQGEIMIDIMSVDENLGKNVRFTLTSSNTAPYHWEYTSAYGATGTWRGFVVDGSLATVATSGDYTDLTNKPTIPAAQVNSDWNAVSGVSQILNKPNLATVATSGSYNDLSNKPTILTEWFGTQAEYDLIDPKDPDTIYHIEGGAPVQSDWNENDNTSLAYIQNKPTIPAAQVQSDWNAVSGMGEILNKPTIPTVNDATITFTQGGTTKGTFTLNQSSDTTIALDAGGGGSTDWSDITNKPNFATVATSGSYNDLTNTPTIPAAQVQSDWNAVSGMGEILNKPSLATVATTGNYSDLNGTPSIPAAQVQSDWSQSDNTQVDYIKNKPTIPAAQVQSDWNANSGMGEILNKPSTETLTFTLQGGTTVTLDVYVAPQLP